MPEEEIKKEDTVLTSQTPAISIFLVDDDKFLLDMYSLKFKKAGCAVDTASSGAEALKKLREGYLPDIILLDIIMPTMDGLELLEVIRQEKLSEKSTVIMLTNQADDNQKAAKFGIDSFIVKALNIPSEVVAQVLDVHKNKRKK